MPLSGFHAKKEGNAAAAKRPGSQGRALAGSVKIPESRTIEIVSSNNISREPDWENMDLPAKVVYVSFLRAEES